LIFKLLVTNGQRDDLLQIESKKLDWNVTSKVGSLDNAQHKPGGGEKKVSRIHLY